MRVRKSVLGLVALGIGSEMTWLFGTPSARQTKRGVRWVLRTPKRLHRLGFPEEQEVGVDEGGKLEDGVESFHRAVRNREAFLLKVLPGSGIERLLRGSLRAREEPRRLALPLYVKLNGRLEAVDLVKGKRGAYAVFNGKRVPVKAEMSEKSASAVKAELERRGFKVLTVRGKRRKDGGGERSEGGLYSVPWDFTAHASGFILARSREEIVKRMLPYLLRAPPEKRSYLVQIMDNMRMALSDILDPQLKFTVQIGFKELKPWLMPRERCETLEKFKESLKSLFRSFFLEPYNLKPGTVEKCVHWWLYQDALFYLKRLLTQTQRPSLLSPGQNLPRA